MLFSKSVTPKCSYCKKGRLLDNNTVLCQKRGMNYADSYCSSFSYDPLKRTPPRPLSPDFSRFTEEDFTL